MVHSHSSRMTDREFYNFCREQEENEREARRAYQIMSNF